MPAANAEFTVTYEIRLPDSFELDENLYAYEGSGDRAAMVESLRARGFVPVWRAIHLGQPPVEPSMTSVDGVKWVAPGSDLDADAREEIEVVLDGLCKDLSTDDAQLFPEDVSEQVLEIPHEVRLAVGDPSTL